MLMLAAMQLRKPVRLRALASEQEKAQCKTMKAVVAFVLLVSAGLLLVITIGGLGAAGHQRRRDDNRLGGALRPFAFLVMRWSRGILPVAAALAIILAIFAAIAAPTGSRVRRTAGSPALPEDLLGLLTLIVVPVQLLLVIVAMIGFNQGRVEEERPIGGQPCTGRIAAAPPLLPPDRRGPG